MINIIGDSCVAADITRGVLHQPYINPFCWNIIDPISFGNLISNYASINYTNISIKKHDTLPKYYILIDNQVKVFYEHYVESKEHTTATIKNNNVYYKNIKQYILDKYKTRLKLNDKPLFIIGHTWNITSKEKAINYEKIILKNNHKYPLLVIVNNNQSYTYLKRYENNYTKIYQTALIKNNTKLAEDLYSKYKDFINQCEDGRPYMQLNTPTVNMRVE